MLTRKLFRFLVSVLLISAAQSAFCTQQILDAYAAAELSGQPWPKLSSFLSGADQETAQRIQRMWVERATQGKPPGGFKLALTTKAAQDRFGISAPLFGVLPASIRKSVGAEIRIVAGRKAMLEIEFGWRLARPVRAVPADDKALRDLFDAVIPVVEIPAVAFAGGPPQGVDILATNTAVFAYVGGDIALPKTVNPEGVQLELLHEGEAVSMGFGNAVDGGQLAALRLLLEIAMAQDWTLAPGQIFLTGALDGLKPPKNGRYQLRADGLNILQFQMQLQ